MLCNGFSDNVICPCREHFIPGIFENICGTTKQQYLGLRQWQLTNFSGGLDAIF
ncbi:Uncharacterised protein [Vibrio cholerae]|nr:Uncharacterised protein [Vibrio cholerae]